MSGKGTKSLKAIFLRFKIKEENAKEDFIFLLF
jgi:hypothetical protein